MLDRAYQEALALVQESNRLLAQADRKMASDEQGIRARSQQERMLRDVWYREALKTVMDRIVEILTEVVDGIIEAHEIFWNDILTNPDYWRGVGHVFWGYGLSIVHSVQGVFQMIAHPVDTAQGVYQAVTHPGQTFNAIVSDIKEKLKTNRGTGELVGDGLLAVFTGGSIKLLKDAGYLARLKKFLPGSRLLDDSPQGRPLLNRINDLEFPFTMHNFRENLAKLWDLDSPPAGYDAHHVFPQKFRDRFDKLGINIDDPAFGAWWEESAHRNPVTIKAYNDAWREFFEEAHSFDEIVNFGRKLAKEYDFDWQY